MPSTWKPSARSSPDGGAPDPIGMADQKNVRDRRMRRSARELEEKPMKTQPKCLSVSLALITTAMVSASSVFAQPVDTTRIEAGGSNDWLTYHGSYKSY